MRSGKKKVPDETSKDFNISSEPKSSEVSPGKFFLCHCTCVVVNSHYNRQVEIRHNRRPFPH